MMKPVLACAWTGIAMIASPAAAGVYGLVVGIDSYATQRDLRGAVNDARDIADALRRTPDVVEVVELIDDMADKEAITTAWQRLLSRAGPGDTLVLTFSGHGQQEPDFNGDEAADGADDRHDEAFLLGGFGAQDAASRSERILDDELESWFAEASRKDVQIVFLADSCYSGTMTRQARSTRLADDYAVTIADAPPAAREPPTVADPDNVTFIAASLETEIVPEVNIGGRMRGAASYAFARALEGMADDNRDGIVTRGELAEYMVTVAVGYGSQATPDVRPRSALSAPLIPAGTPGNLPEPGITVATSTGILPVGVNAPLAEFGEATLNWDAGAGTITNAEGDILAYDVSERHVSTFLEKYDLVEHLKALTARAPLRVTLDSGARALFPGDRTAIRISRADYPWLTAFGIDNIGRIILLFPALDGDVDGEADRWGETFHVEVTSEGVGEELVAVLATPEPPDAFRAALAAGAAPARVADLLRQSAAAGMNMQAGFASLITKRKIP